MWKEWMEMVLEHWTEGDGLRGFLRISNVGYLFSNAMN
jgi:hypothetical protein